MNIQTPVGRTCANRREAGFFDPKYRLRTLLISRVSRSEEACYVKR